MQAVLDDIDIILTIFNNNESIIPKCQKLMQDITNLLSNSDSVVLIDKITENEYEINRKKLLKINKYLKFCIKIVEQLDNIKSFIFYIQKQLLHEYTEYIAKFEIHNFNIENVRKILDVTLNQYNILATELNLAIGVQARSPLIQCIDKYKEYLVTTREYLTLPDKLQTFLEYNIIHSSKIDTSNYTSLIEFIDFNISHINQVLQVACNLNAKEAQAEHALDLLKNQYAFLGADLNLTLNKKMNLIVELEKKILNITFIMHETYRLAQEGKDDELLELLQQQNVDLEAAYPDHNLQRPIDFVMYYGKTPKTLDFLLEQNVDVTSDRGNASNTLKYAEKCAKNGNSEPLEKLKKYLQIVPPDMENLCMWSCQGNDQALLEMLQQPNIDLEAAYPNQDKQRPIDFVMYYGKTPKTLDYLLEQNVDVTSERGLFGDTLKQAAAAAVHGNPEPLKKLIQHLNRLVEETPQVKRNYEEDSNLNELQGEIAIINQAIALEAKTADYKIKQLSKNTDLKTIQIKIFKMDKELDVWANLMQTASNFVTTYCTYPGQSETEVKVIAYYYNFAKHILSVKEFFAPLNIDFEHLQQELINLSEHYTTEQILEVKSSLTLLQLKYNNYGNIEDKLAVIMRALEEFDNRIKSNISTLNHISPTFNYSNDSKLFKLLSKGFTVQIKFTARLQEIHILIKSNNAQKSALETSLICLKNDLGNKTIAAREQYINLIKLKFKLERKELKLQEKKIAIISDYELKRSKLWNGLNKAIGFSSTYQIFCQSLKLLHALEPNQEEGSKLLEQAKRKIQDIELRLDSLKAYVADSF